MTVKRIIAVFLAAAMLICLCGCSEEKTESNAAGDNVLIIGSDIYEPYFYIAENGDFTGVDVDIAREVCKRINVEPIFKKINWQNKDSYLENGGIDCLWACFSMTGREELYNWAGPYLKSRQVVIVNANSDIYTLGDLNGKDIAVQNGTKPEELFLKNMLPQVTKVKNIYSFSTASTVFAALKKGYVDACAGHETAYRELMKNAAGDYRILDEPLAEVELGVAFYRENKNPIINEITAALKEIGRDGTLEKIIESYGLDKSLLGV